MIEQKKKAVDKKLDFALCEDNTARFYKSLATELKTKFLYKICHKRVQIQWFIFFILSFFKKSDQKIKHVSLLPFSINRESNCEIKVQKNQFRTFGFKQLK